MYKVVSIFVLPVVQPFIWKMIPFPCLIRLLDFHSPCADYDLLISLMSNGH